MKLMKNLAKFALSGALVAGLVLVASSRAEASLQVLLQEDGGAWTQAVGSPYGNFTAQTFGNSTFGDFSLTLANVSAVNGAGLSDLLSSALKCAEQQHLHSYAADPHYRNRFQFAGRLAAAS